MFTVYILYSASFCKTYVGFTNNIMRRMEEHNTTSITGYTKNYRPWVLIYSEPFDVKAMALKKEKYFKTGVGRDEIKKILGDFLLKT